MLQTYVFMSLILVTMLIFLDANNVCKLCEYKLINIHIYNSKCTYVL